MRILFILPVTLLLSLISCNSHADKELIIFHAGSLTVPVKELNEAFEKANPGVKVLSEAAGSVVSARKVTELGKPCDILLSADYFVIDNMLIPRYTDWNVKFATNEIVIAYKPEAAYGAIIRADNWINVLLKDDVIYGRSDPDSDPCGYRTVFAAILASDFYGRPGLADSLLGKDKQYIRPKEVDLVALVETGVIDYMFQYKSVAIQHGLKYLELPDSINLSSLALKDYYSTVSYLIPGSEPGSRTEVKGDYIAYSGTVLKDAPHRELAMKYFSFLLSDEGKAIFAENGQEPIVPAVSPNSDEVPASLRKYIVSEEVIVE